MANFLDTLKEKLDPESLRKLADVRAAVEGRFMKLPDGVNTVRILPSSREGGLWFREVRNHFRVGGGDRNRVVICSRSEDPNLKCFVDEAIAFLSMSPSKEDQEAARLMKVSRIFWVNAYDVHAREPVVKILPLSFTVFGQVFQLYVSGENFVDPDEGFNVVITKNPGNRYNVRLERNPSAIASKDLLGQMHDLDAIAKDQIKTYEEQKALFPPELVKQIEGRANPQTSLEKSGTQVNEELRRLAASVAAEEVDLDDLQ